MSDNKKYYYLKLKENFFDREEIKVIRGMDKGDTYINIMLEMYLRSLKRGGQLMMTDTIPFNLQTLSSVLSRDVDEVKFAIDLFKQFDLLDILDSGAMFMSDIENFIGHGSSESERKAQYRKRIKDEKTASGQCPDVRPPEIELEKEIELDIELDIKTKRTPPAPKGVLDLCKYSSEITLSIESYETHIKALGKGYKKTGHAWSLFLGKVDKFISSYGEQVTIDCINSAIEGNWKTLYEPRAKQTNVRQTANNTMHSQYEGVFGGNR